MRSEMDKLINKINYLYDEITKIEDNTRTSLALSGFLMDDRIPQEQFDYSSIYDELKSILVPVLNQYKILLRSSIAGKMKKVFFVAICEMIKQDYTRGMLITFRYVTQEDVNINHYYSLLTIVSKDQGLSIPEVNGRRQFEEAYILETGIPRNLSKYVIKAFRIYWRYFRTFEKDARLNIIHDYFLRHEFSDVYIINPEDYRSLETYCQYLNQFPEKTIRVFKRLDDIFQVLDEYSPTTLDCKDKYQFIDIINNQVGYDITYVLKDSDMEKIYYSYLNKVPINKFDKILKNLPKEELILFPSGEQRRVANLSTGKLCYGIYKVRNIEYEVIADPTIDIIEMARSQCDTVVSIADDYYMYVSLYEFDVEVDGKVIYPRKLIYKNIERYVWIGKLGPASVAYVDGNIIRSKQNVKVNGKIIKCFDYEIKQSRLLYVLSSLKMIFPEKKYGRLMYSLDDAPYELVAAGSPQGIYYRENFRIELPAVKGKHFIRFAINDDVIHEETLILEDLYLFDKWQGTLYSTFSINESNSGSLIVFTTTEIDPESFEYKVENSYQWGDYKVYEFSVDTHLKTIEICSNNYVFGKTEKPYFLFYSETGNVDMINDIKTLRFKVFNTGDREGYWFFIENTDKCIRADINDGTYCIDQFLTEDQSKTCGKWNCSLWYHQEKIHECTYLGDY